MIMPRLVVFSLVVWIAGAAGCDDASDEVGAPQDKDTGADGDVDGDTDGDTDGDADGDGDADTDTDADADSDTDADSDADGDSDTEPLSYPTNVDDSCQAAPAMGENALSVLEASNEFGFELFKEMVDRADGENVSISPFSMHSVWSMLLNGARSTGAEEIKETLALSSMDLEAMNEGYRELKDGLGARDEEVTLDIASSIWMSELYSDYVVPEFLEASAETFDAPATILDFQAEDAADTINGWVNENTGGRIDDLVEDPIPVEVAMYLINAVYFEGSWTFEFDPEDTAAAPFTTLSDEERSVQTMHMAAGLRYYQDDEIQLVELPYTWGVFAMSVILPREGVDIAALVDGLTPELWESWHQASWIHEVNLALPRFEVEFDAVNGESAQLIAALKAMGIESVFYPDPTNLSGLIVPPPEMVPYVSDVKQKTYLKVHEKGAEAAAASMIEISIAIDGGGTPPRDMTVDRPFLFAIHDRCTGGILFLGQINDPPPIAE